MAGRPGLLKGQWDPWGPLVSDPGTPPIGPGQQRRRRHTGVAPATTRRGGAERKRRTGHYFERRDYRSKEGSTPRRSSQAAHAGVDGDVDGVNPCGGRSTGVLGFEPSEHQAMRACARWAPRSSRSSLRCSGVHVSGSNYGGDGMRRRELRTAMASAAAANRAS